MASDETEKEPWHQLPDEPAAAYTLFLKFCQMSRRSLDGFAKKVLRKKHASDGLTKLAKRFDWNNRADHYDVWRAGLRREQMERREHRAATSEMNAVIDSTILAAEAIRRLKIDFRNDRKKRLGIRDTRELIATSVSLRRLLHDRPQQIVGYKRVRDELRDKIESVARELGVVWNKSKGKASSPGDDEIGVEVPVKVEHSPTSPYAKTH